MEFVGMLYTYLCMYVWYVGVMEITIATKLYNIK